MIEEPDKNAAELPEDPEVVAARSEYLKYARDAYDQGKSFQEVAHLQRWRRNYALAQSEHPEDSKYHSPAYVKRSRYFRGKTEASIRKNEAAAAVALFSNRDVLTITPSNQGQKTEQTEIIDTIHQLCNHHLDNDIPWFMTVIGGYHDVMIAGDIVTEQYWNYENREGEVLKDWPAIELHPLENVKISPYADWIDPIHSSPFVVIETPMFIGDIKERPDWIKYEDREYQRAAGDAFERSRVKSAREGRGTAIPEEAQKPVYTDFDIVFVHKNFIRMEGEDLFFYSLGTTLLLSDPVLVKEQYPHLKRGQRPLVWGTATIEPHKVYRRSLVDRVAQSQAKSNEIDNLRFDNVRQVLNKRKYVQRYMGVDYNALSSSVPGGWVMMDDINAVKPEDTPDVTGSSYQEQNLVNVDFDDLAGSFSMSSVASNRNLNETVGGMNLLSGNANTLTEYQLRILVETWIEPVIRQVVQMVQFYEDDKTIQEITGKQITNEQLGISVKVRVGVGFGATDPQGKIQKLVYGIGAAAQLPGGAQRLNGVEIAKEMFGALGYNDGEKFFNDEQAEDPRIAELMKKLQELSQIIQTKQIEGQSALQLEAAKGKNSMIETVVKTTADRQIKLTGMALQQGIQLKELEAKVGIDSGKMNLEFLKEINRRLDIDSRNNELEFKARTGEEGI